MGGRLRGEIVCNDYAKNFNKTDFMEDVLLILKEIQL